jgi:hypothetical protein
LAWARGFSKEMVLAKLGAAITAAMSPHPATVPAPERA